MTLKYQILWYIETLYTQLYIVRIIYIYRIKEYGFRYPSKISN